LPSFDADVFEHEAHQLLSALEVEGVDAGEGFLGEAGDVVVEAVVGGQFGLTFEEGLAFLVEEAGADVDLF
jgi:hypothetical protein